MVNKEPFDRTSGAPAAERDTRTEQVRSIVLVLVLLAFGVLLYAMTVVKLLE